MAIKRDDHVLNDYGDGAAWIRGPLLGKGSFGRVYKATLKNSRSKYSCFPSEMAVKSAEVSVSSTLQKEKEIMNNLNASPYVITCLGEETTMGDNGVMAYNLLLEYGSGGTLADRIKKSGVNGLPELEVKMHTRSILRGLNHIHGLGYVHRDLKPDNILLMSSDGRIGITKFRAKICDFGLAKREKQSNKKRKIMEPYYYWRGTPMYLSPEAVIDSVQDAPSDVWAVGCIVLEMLTGKPAWDGEKEEILRRIGAENELPKIANEISKEARDFLKRCFVRKSMFRFTCEMLLNHPFVDCLDEYDDELEDSESMALISESGDDECSSDECEEDSFCSSSEEDTNGMDDDESVSGLAEENESEVVAIQHFDGSNEAISSRHVYERQHHPVRLTIPA